MKKRKKVNSNWKNKWLTDKREDIYTLKDGKPITCIGNKSKYTRILLKDGWHKVDWVTRS